MDIDSTGGVNEAPFHVTEEGLAEVAKLLEGKLESLRGQYENQLDSLRTEIDRSRERRNSKEDGGSSGGGSKLDLQQQYRQVKEELGRSLPGEQKDQLDSLVSGMDEQYQAQLEDMHRQHVDDVDEQVKVMRSTLEEIYSSQLEVVRSEMEQSHQTAVLVLRESLDKNHKEDLNKIEHECNNKLEEQKQDHEKEMTEKNLADAIVIGKEDSASFISRLNKKLTEEHKQIIQQIESDLGKTPASELHHRSQDSLAERDDSVSVASGPTTKAEYKHVEDKDRQKVLNQADDVQKSLDSQIEEISALRAQMLGEHEQMLSVRAEVMSSQSGEVEKLQQEMAQIQQQYEDQMVEFQGKVQSQTESALKSSHEKELDEMKEYYETKVSEMEQSYTTDIAQLKQEHVELLARLQLESSGTGVDIPSTQQLPAGNHREYVRRTMMLTAISDEDESPEATPPGTEVLEGRIKILEDKISDKDRLVGELKKRLEAEATSAEDLHGKLLDSNKTLDDYEDSLKSKSDEIEELRKALTSRDSRIGELENEKAALEEKGEKGPSSKDEGTILKELQDRIKKLENELSDSKQANVRIQQELNQLDSQHGEAVMKLKEEMDNLTKSRIEELETAFQIQLEEELKQQAEELDNKYKDEISRQGEELEIYKTTEVDLKEKLNIIQREHEKQVDELKEKYESESSEMGSKESVLEPKMEVSELMETQVKSPTQTIDRDTLEAAIREDVKSEILQEYEQSIDTLKNEYEVRISEMNTRLQSFETQDVEKAEVTDREKEFSDSEESEIKEKLKAELAHEFKEKLQTVTDEYESKLKKLQDIVDSRKEVKSAVAPYALARSKSLDLMPEKEKDKSKTPTGNEGFVSTIRREYEDKINSLQMQIAQYRSTVGSVPSSTSSPTRKPLVELAVGGGEVIAEMKSAPDAGSEISIKSKHESSEIRQEIYDEITCEVEASFNGLKTGYENHLQEVTAKLELLQAESVTDGDYENKIREEVVKEYEAKIEKLKQDYESQIAEIKKENEAQVDQLTNDLEKAKSDRLAAEQKVKADMFVWHEEIVTQLKRKHEGYESLLRKEYEEKMDLYKEEIQEEFDAEKDKIMREHKRELMDLEDRYDTLVEGLRTGEVPEVAEIVQQKFDMELEMAKTLIQQECDETIEAEQTRMSEQFEKEIQKLMHKRDQEHEEQQVHHEKELNDLRNSLLQQYESQIIERESQHKAVILKMKAEYETLFLKTEVVEKFEMESAVKEKADPVKEQISDEPPETEEGETEEEAEKVTSPDFTSDKSDKDDDDDDKGDGKGGAKLEPKPSQSADSGDKHEQEKHMDEKGGDGKDETDDTREEVIETMERVVKETAGRHTVKLVTTMEREVKESVEKPPVKLVQADKPDATMERVVKETVEKPVERQSVKHVHADKPDTTMEREVKETMVREVKETIERRSVKHVHADTAAGQITAETDTVQQLRQQLDAKTVEYESNIAQLKASHEEEVRQLTEELINVEAEYLQKIAELEESHDHEVKQYQESMQKLREGLTDLDDPEALELAHQQEMQDLEERLVQKHMNEMNNVETQHQSRLDELTEKHRVQIEELQGELIEAQQAVEQYPDPVSSNQIVPTFHIDSTLGSTKESTVDFMVPTGRSHSDSEKSAPGTVTMDTQVFEARSGEDRSEEDVSLEGSIPGTLEEIAVQSLDTSAIDTSMDQSRADTSMDQSRGDTSMDQSRGTLRGVDTTQDTEIIQYSEEEDSDKSMEEGIEKSDRSTPPVLMQTLGYGADIPGGPTVKSLDDTADSSIRASDREEMALRIKELESEVEELRRRLRDELNKQDEQMERLDREKQEESNLTTMLREDIERLNNDRDALQNTNEHLLGLLSDSVKTYMSADESITKKMKAMMEKSAGRVGEKARPGSAERKRTPPPGKRSPATSPGRLSPAKADDGDGAQDTSIMSNVTDEGLDLSQRITDSIFQGPELVAEEEELLTDSGSRLRTSVNHLLDMIEETTTQLLDTRHTHAEMMDTLEGKGHDIEQLTSRCSDLEERLKEEVERKDFLALELHKAEGLIEGYSSERESLDLRINELEEHRENLVLELETSKNKLLDLESIQAENEQLKQEMKAQQELMTRNVGDEAQATRAQEAELEPPSGGKALMLEVTRLNSESREKDEQIKQVHDRFESRVRELENSGEDMETHFGKLVDERKQEVADLKLQVEVLEKQLKAKKQFLEEQSSEREQEHEEYQMERDTLKKTVHDLEKQNGTGSRLQREIDDLTEQLQSHIDLHSQALLESEKFQRESRDKDLSVKELKAIIQQLEQDLQDKIHELEQSKEKLKHVEDELSRRPYADDDLSEGTKSDVEFPDTGSSLEFGGTTSQKNDRAVPQMTVEEEMRQAATKTKEELVREKFTLQSQVNDHLVQISSLRNQLDDMRHRRGLDDVPEATKRLDFEREKSEEKDKEIAELKLQVEVLDEKIENREQQIEQLREQRDRGKQTRGSPVEGIEFESDREIEKQIEALKRENKQLRERVKLSEASSVTDISGLSQNLLEEKNQEIDHLSEQILRVQSDFNDLKADRGVQNLYEEIEDLQEEVTQKEREICDLQCVRMSAAFTDHSLTPDSSLMNVGASFSEKASIQQEMEESVANRLEKLAGVESEMVALRAALHNKEEQIVILETELSTFKEDLQGKDEMIIALQTKPRQIEPLVQGMPDDIGMLQSMIQEKEDFITQLTIQVDSLQAEVDNLSDFQNKLQEDFDTVQMMLEERDREIDSLTKELTDQSSTDEHSLVIKHEVEIARLKKDLREKDNIVEEKLEELAELSDKVELLESHIVQYKSQVTEYDEQILIKDRDLKKIKRQLDISIEESLRALTPDEKDTIITEKTVEIERLNKELETTALGRPPSPPRSEDEKSLLIKQQQEEIQSLQVNVQTLIGRPPSPQLSEDDKSAQIAELKQKIVTLMEAASSLGYSPAPSGEVDENSDVVLRLRTEIEKLKQQIVDINLSEDDKFVLIRDLRLENETFKKQIDAALKIRPPSPPMDDDEKSELVHEQKKEIKQLKSQVDAALKIRPPSPPKSEDEKAEIILTQKIEITKLQKQVETEDKEGDINLKEAEVNRLKTELSKVTEAIENGEERKLVKEKIHEAEQLKIELEKVKQILESRSASSVESVVQEKDNEIKSKNRELRKAEESVQKLEEELQSAKEVRSYEDEIELKEKEDEIEELQAELNSYRSRTESTLGQSVDLEMSLDGESNTSNAKQLVKSLSFYKEQYEEKCSDARQVQVQLDLVKQQLEKSRSEKLEDAQEEIELYKAELDRKSQTEVHVLKSERALVEKEKEQLKTDLSVVKERLGQTTDEKIILIETELQLTKDELARERKDSVQAINDLENLRERKEKERRGSLKTIQELEHDLEEKIVKEKELNIQIRQLSEELTLIKKQYGIIDKSVAGESSRSSPKSAELRSHTSFELGTDVETLQQQVIQYKQHADKAREILSEKQKYQSQVVKLEIQQEQLQKKMKKDVGQLEEQLKAYNEQPDYNVWTQLHATQERLEKTTEQLSETGHRLNETDTNLSRVSSDLASREADMRELQQDLWKTSGQLSVTSGKLQETEEKLRQMIGQVSEREEQIHQLQGELQHTQHEAEKVSKKLKDVPVARPDEVDKLRKQLTSTKSELEAVKKSLNEAVEMSEQQLQMVENKDQEYVKLKLDIQQTMADKEKTIREQRHKLKEKEQEVSKAKQEVKEKDKVVSKVKQEVKDKENEIANVKQEVEKMSAASKKKDASSAAVEGTSNMGALRLQLQNQEEVILTLGSDLGEARTTVQDREKEIDNIHQSHKQAKDDEADTIQAMHDQMAVLQRELQELRTATKAQGQQSRSHDDEGRERSPYDQNGRQVSGYEQSYRDQRSDESLGEIGRRRSPDQVASPAGQTFDQYSRIIMDEQEDSGHQSFDHPNRGPDYSSEGHSLSPRQLRPIDEAFIGEIQRSETSQVYRTPIGSCPGSGSHPGSTHMEPAGHQAHRSPSGSRSGSVHSGSSPTGSQHGSSRGSSRHDSPHSVGMQDGATQAYSPPTRDGPHTQSSHRSEDAQDARSSTRSPPSARVTESQRSPSRTQGHPHQFEERVANQGSSLRGSPTETLTSPSRTSTHGHPDQFDQRGEGQRSSVTRSPTETQRLPSRPSTEFNQNAEGQRSSLKGSPTESKRSSSRSSPAQGQYEQRDEGRRSSPQRSPSFDLISETADRMGHQRPPVERQGVGASFSIDDDRQIYQARPQLSYDESERYVGEDGQLYDRDGNIRPRYSHAVEGQHGHGHSRQGHPGQSDADERAQYQRQHPSEGRESPVHRLQRVQEESSSQNEGQVQSEGQGMSTEAERYIQQLRRELLITKTALMQIQRGERLDDDDITTEELVAIETESRSARGQGDMRYHTQPDRRRDTDETRYNMISSEENLNRVRRKLEKAEEELTLFRTSSNLSARDFVQKVMNLKDELSNEHQRHIQEMTTRAHHDTETQLAAMRIKYMDEMEHIKRLHGNKLEERLQDLKQKLERKQKSEMNKMVLKHQEEVGALKMRIGADLDDSTVYDREQRRRQDGVGADSGMMNGKEPMSGKLQGILQRLHSEGVQVLTISELECLHRSQSQSVPDDADVQSMQAGWENERQTMLSTIQSLKDLLSQTHKLRGLDKNLEGSDWRAELLRAIGYVFSKERETLLAELRSHVLSHPSYSVDETQRLEQKIRTMESHHHAALDQIFNADRQSMLAEIRDYRAHATITRMHNQEERDRLGEKITSTEDMALKKERQLKREVQLLEFKIQQEKVLQEDLRTSLDCERNRSGELSGLLNQEKTSNLDLQTTISTLQIQVGKLREGLEREQSRYVSVTNALEEEKSKSLNLSDLLESERESLWRVQAEVDALKQQQTYMDPHAIEQIQVKLNAERDRRCQGDSQHEIDMVTVENLRQEVEMGKRHQQAMETELRAKVSQLQRGIDMERQKQEEVNRALERERSLSAHLQQSLEAEQSNSERNIHRDQSTLEDLQIQLKTERANLDDLNRALQREQSARDEAESEKSLIKDHLNQERALNEDLKHDIDKLQFERLEAVNKLQKEREMVSRVKSERDQVNEELRAVKSREMQRDHDREAERLASKRTVREADREKADYRIKLHEQELESQRHVQKACSLEEQLAESQENELKAIRELEHLKIETAQPSNNTGAVVAIQTSPRPDPCDGLSRDLQSGPPEGWHVYRSQLESMCQSLHYLILRCREQLNKASHGGGRQTEISDFDALQRSLRDLLSEVKQLQEMEGDYMSHPAGTVNERILRQNEELTNFVARISEEKTELRNTLTRLEEEIWRYRQMDSKYQEMQRESSGVDHQLIAGRSEWAKEKLTLQMALNSAQREIDLLQTDLRVEREKRVAAGITDTRDTDKIKIQRLYGKYLRAESFRKALIYQKKYLLLLLGGFQDTEETTLALLSRMGAIDPRDQNAYKQKSKPLTMFRGAVRVVIAIQRMKFLVKKWRRATRVGSEVVAGSVDQTNGYIPHSNGYSPPRHSSASRVSSSIPVRSSSSSPARTSSYRQALPSHATDAATYLSPRFDADSYSSSSYTSPRVIATSYVPSTPPTKDYSSTTKYTSPSSGARRKILTSTSIPAPRSGHVRFSADDSKNGDLSDNDDYINRLENLQSRLGTLQNGRHSGYRQAWR